MLYVCLLYYVDLLKKYDTIVTVKTISYKYKGREGEVGGMKGYYEE